MILDDVNSSKQRFCAAREDGAKHVLRQQELTESTHYLSWCG